MRTKEFVVFLACVTASPILNSAPATSHCGIDATRLIDPLLGTWTEYQITASSREKLGTLVTRRVAGNCGLKQSFVSQDGQFSFESLGYIDDTGSWLETFVMSFGKTATYRWRKENQDLVMEQIDSPADAKKRLRIYDITDANYWVADERSTDNGLTWKLFELVETVRIDGENNE